MWQTLTAQILGRWVISWMLLGCRERYEKHRVCHIAKNLSGKGWGKGGMGRGDGMGEGGLPNS